MVAGTIGLLAVAIAAARDRPARSRRRRTAGTRAFAGVDPARRARRSTSTCATSAATPARLSACRGRPSIVTFMYTTCKDDCPTMAPADPRRARRPRRRRRAGDRGQRRPRERHARRARAFLVEQQPGSGRMRFALGDRAAAAARLAELRDPARRRRRSSTRAWVAARSTPTAASAIGFPVRAADPRGPRARRARACSAAGAERRPAPLGPAAAARRALAACRRRRGRARRRPPCGPG